MLSPDIIANVHMRASDKGGKSVIIPAVQYRCQLIIDSLYFDCRLLLDQTGVSLEPGKMAEIQVKFLFDDVIFNHLRIGAKFSLWDMRVFADGEILKVISRPSI